MLGDQVNVEYCRQRKGWEQKEGRKEFDGDWTCFKVQLHACAYLNCIVKHVLCMYSVQLSTSLDEECV